MCLNKFGNKEKKRKVKKKNKTLLLVSEYLQTNWEGGNACLENNQHGSKKKGMICVIPMLS